MKTVNGLLKQFEAIQINDVVFASMVETEVEYVKKNQQQMLSGYNSEGNRIGRYANPVYKAKKTQMNPLASGYVDLKLTGKFQGDMFARTDNEGYLVGSEDKKTNILQEKYGEEIFTLSTNNRGKFIEESLLPVTIEKVSNKLR